jgi:hypothetical protein
MHARSSLGVMTLALTLAVAASISAPRGHAASGARTARSAAPSPAVQARERRMKAVVRRWSARLNAGDNEGVARLFSVPALMIQGSYAYRLRSREQIAQWHSGLPCSGEIVSIAIKGRFATAVFRLGDRGASACDAPGELVAARFEIVDGRIVVWQQVPLPKKPEEPGPVL